MHARVSISHVHMRGPMQGPCKQCAHAWAFQAVQTVWLCCRKAVPYCGNLGACCLLPFAVVSCARAKGRFHSPLRMCHAGQQQGLFQGILLRRPLQTAGCHCHACIGGPGLARQAWARSMGGALCCAAGPPGPSPHAGGCHPGNLFRRPSQMPQAVGCHSHACRGGPAGVILRRRFALRGSLEPWMSRSVS